MGRSKKKKQSRTVQQNSQVTKNRLIHKHQEANPSLFYAVNVVGTAFVEQYYHILLQSPKMAHRFYQDSSLLGRPDINGDMTIVTTMQGINEKILSLNYENYKAEIKAVDALESYKSGIIILVIGCLTGEDNVRKNFTQTFFLAPQDKGYFVLNDMFRYIGGDELQIDSVPPTNDINDNTSASALSPEPDSTYNLSNAVAKVNESPGGFVAQEDAPNKTNASTRNKKAMRSLPECIPPYTLTCMPWIPPSDQQSTNSEEFEEAESDKEGRNYSGNGGFYKKTSRRNKWVPDSKQLNLKRPE